MTITGDLLAAYALVLTVVALLQTLWYPDIAKAGAALKRKQLPQYYEDGITLWRDHRLTFWGRSLPLCLATILSLGAFAWPCVAVITASYRAVHELSWGAFQYYDAVAAGFVLVSLLTLYVAVLQLIQAGGFVVSRLGIALLPRARDRSDH